MNERAVDFSISTGAAALGVALLVAAVLRLSEPIAPQIAAMPANVLVPSYSVHAVRAHSAVNRPRVTLQSAPKYRVTIAVKRTAAWPIARALIAVKRVAAKHGVPAPANSPAQVRPRGHRQARSRARSAAAEANTVPEPPIGYDPVPALAAPDLGLAPPAIDTSDWPGVLLARRHRR